ncbi:DUF982 domain-containing protein [Mesorhizobium sp. NZP2234]|uniref:DUF982 domain-containing protein n=1 Tax=Mesorhizobium sp. NZP2234 TaxID=2483402 RepID=UPI001551FD1A|nr:DUF982 domain-containing protein [Mesorhizobium sp. NZP2234]QKC89266.1 DUF982 domain-containing protein [Mesorhizobium sp. NZP2234]
MTSLAFLAPVQVKTSNVVHDINTVREALVFLNQWPKARRGPISSCAVRGCNAAIAGQMPTEQARQAFVSFAETAGVLAKSDFPPLAGADQKLSVSGRSP